MAAGADHIWGGGVNNPLADLIGEPTDEQLRRIAALLRLRQLPEKAPQEGQQAA